MGAQSPNMITACLVAIWVCDQAITDCSEAGPSRNAEKEQTRYGTSCGRALDPALPAAQRSSMSPAVPSASFGTWASFAGPMQSARLSAYGSLCVPADHVRSEVEQLSGMRIVHHPGSVVKPGDGPFDSVSTTLQILR